MAKRGIWINERDFVAFSDNKKTLSSEIASRKRAIDFYSLGMYLPNPDPVLKKQGKDITIYNELLADGHLGGCVTSRKAGVKSLEWEIDRGKSKSLPAELITDLFKDLDLETIISEILNAPLYGYQPLEVLWERTGKYILPKAVVGKPQEWFVFSEDNELKFRTKDNYNGEDLPERKFLLARHEPTYKNPYGFPELSRCFWPVTFKKGGFKFWVLFTEKYGMPFAVGKVPRGTSQPEIDNLADMLANMVQDAIAVIPDDSSVEILEAGGKGASAQIYEKLIGACKVEVSIAILGQNLTTEVKGGSYAAAESHMSVRKDIIDSDKKLTMRVMNQLIQWIWELNFASGERPVFTMYEEEDVDDALAKRDKTLSETGVRFSKGYFEREYGFQKDDIEEVVSPGQSGKPAEFAEPGAPAFADQQALDELEESLSPEQLQEQVEGVLKPIIELIEKSDNHEDAMEKLLEAFPDMDTKFVEDMLARAIFISELWGRLNAEA
ncbi:MAG TPA: DUF935 family protein [Nitrospirae bacterium]|nr:DUF935 family protein [Nitrospirota bacterium]HDH51235.1 DUF935 family protein [Nitrospirota bacterium]HDK81017.1 DUF935 family protein [Nitrospirota bacterium]